MESTTRYVLDFDRLDKGSVVPPSTLEKVTGEVRGTQEYVFKVLALRDLVARELAARGRPATVVCRRKVGLRVLTDPEAAAYNARAFGLGLRRSRRSLRRLVSVDVRGLTAEQRAEHERNVLVLGQVMHAATRERVRLTARPHARSVPGLPAAGADRA